MPAEPAPTSPLGGDPAATGRVRLLRWVIKLSGLLVLVYYLLPAKVNGVPVYWAIVGGALLIAAIESARRIWGFTLPTLRDYERDRLPSYVYWAAALGTIVAFFPEGVAVATLIGAAFADIGASLVRSRFRGARFQGLAAFLIFLAIAFTLLPQLSVEPLEVSFAMALLGAVVVAAVEGIRIRGLDDDLLMPLLPALLWVAMSHVVGGATPLTLHWPWLSRG